MNVVHKTERVTWYHEKGEPCDICSAVAKATAPIKSANDVLPLLLEMKQWAEQADLSDRDWLVLQWAYDEAIASNYVEVWAGQKWLANHLGLSVKAVRLALAALVAEGWLYPLKDGPKYPPRRKRWLRYGRPNVYVVRQKPPLGHMVRGANAGATGGANAGANAGATPRTR